MDEPFEGGVFDNGFVEAHGEFSQLLRWLLRAGNPWETRDSRDSADKKFALLNSSLSCLFEPVATLRPVPIGGEKTGRPGPLLKIA